MWPTRYQRIEGFVVLLVVLFFYIYFGYKILWLVVLFFSIDASMIGYLLNNKIGAHVYNIGHSFFLPLVLLTAAVTFHYHLLLGLSFIWLAHIGLDRSLGYGLKLETGFKDTHLGMIGKDKRH